MCRTFLTFGGLQLPDELGPRGDTPRFVDVGDATSLAVRRWGKGGLGIEWARMTFGLRARSGDTLPQASLDRIEMLWGYDGVASNPCAVPLYGYRRRHGAEWTKVQAGWALGSFDPLSGFLLFSAVDGIPMPVVAAWPDARRWLLSENREQMRLLRDIADGTAGHPLVEPRLAAGVLHR